MATHAYRRIYETWPEMDEQYGVRGRHFTAEDNVWHLNYLDMALALNDPSRFDSYADWLVDFLRPRGMEVGHVAGAFAFLAEALRGVVVAAEEEPSRERLLGLLDANTRRLAPSACWGDWSGQDRKE